MGRKKRRNWSNNEKRMICAQTRVPGISVSQVARRYDVNGAYILSLTGRFAGCRGPRLSCNAVAEEWFSGHGPLCYVRTD